LILGTVRVELEGELPSGPAQRVRHAHVIASRSLQAVLYLGTALYGSLIVGGYRRPAILRLWHVGVLFGSFLATLVGWTAGAATMASRLSFGRLLGILFSRPKPSLFPHNISETVRMLRDTDGMLATLGIAAFRFVLPGRALPERHTQLAIGAVSLVAVLLVLADSFRRLRSADGGRQIHVFAATLALFVILTSYYQTAERDNIKRYDFLPLLIVFLVIEYTRRLSPQKRWIPTAVALVFVCWEGAGASHWWRVTLSTPPRRGSDWVHGEHPAPAKSGLGQTSWYDQIVTIQRDNPRACRYVFSARELDAGHWWYEIPGLLWSEMHDTHLVLATRSESRGWKRAPRFVSAEDLARNPQLQKCAWLSNPAAADLQSSSLRPASPLPRASSPK
jgi:hypothetical protein